MQRGLLCCYRCDYKRLLLKDKEITKQNITKNYKLLKTNFHRNFGGDKYLFV